MTIRLSLLSFAFIACLSTQSQGFSVKPSALFKKITGDDLTLTTAAAFSAAYLMAFAAGFPYVALIGEKSLDNVALFALIRVPLIAVYSSQYIQWIKTTYESVKHRLEEKNS